MASRAAGRGVEQPLLAAARAEGGSAHTMARRRLLRVSARFLVWSLVVFPALGCSAAGPAKQAPNGTPSRHDVSGEQPIDTLDLVRRTSPTNAELRRMTPEEQLQALARCVPARETRYCIFFGVGAHPDYAALTREYLTGPEPSIESTGDLSLRDWVKQRLAMSNQERLAAELEAVTFAS